MILKEEVLNTEKVKDLSETWLEWHVARSKEDEQELVCLNYKLKKIKLEESEIYKVKIPILALYHLAEKYSWLQVLRNPEHKPIEPMELVRFIQTLETLE